MSESRHIVAALILGVQERYGSTAVEEIVSWAKVSAPAISRVEAFQERFGPQGHLYLAALGFADDVLAGASHG